MGQCKRWLFGFSLIIITSSACTPVSAQTGRVYHTVAVVGNLADLDNAETWSLALDSLLDGLGHNHTVLLAGDLVPGKDFPPDTRKLVMCIERLRNPENRRIILIPGDRDWADSGADGWSMVKALEDEISPLLGNDVKWPLRGGCPGPERISLDLTLNLVVLNTQWWNHPHDKPRPASASCDIATREEVIEELKDELDASAYGNLIMAGHYPVISNGEYGGSFPVSKWLFPIPLASTMYTAYRQNVGTPKEIVNSEYNSFVREAEDILKEYNSLLYVSGHERNREVFTYFNNILVNSGAPEAGKYVRERRETLFASSDPGIVLLDFDSDGNVFARNYEYDGKGFHKGSEVHCMQAPCKVPVQDVIVNERLVPCLDDAHVLTEMQEEHPGMVQVVPNRNYRAGGFQRTFLGEHYRAAWTSEVTLPVLDLDQVAGGLRPYAYGGGTQTISLKMDGEDGYDYVFRSVDKDPSGALKYDLRKSFISVALKDQTTSQHPFGSVVASALLDRAGILHPRPSPWVMADDEKLGPFRSMFGNLIGTLEEFPSGSKDVYRTFNDADEVSRTVHMYRMLLEDGGNSIETSEYLRARLMDILLGDCSRHEDNWKWAGYRYGQGWLYRPVPRDRDMVFALWDGVIPWIADRGWAKPDAENFDYEIKGMRSLTWQSRHMDRFLLNEAGPADWLEQSAIIQAQLTDSVIKAALNELPQGISDSRSMEIEGKLIARLKDMDAYALQYSNMISKQVDVVGTINDDKFYLNRNPDGSVEVRVTGPSSNNGDTLLYVRRFDPEVTDEIRLFGLPGNDSIWITGTAKRSILTRVVPGYGDDFVSDSSDVGGTGRQTKVYTRETNDVIEGAKEFKKVKVPKPAAYEYRIDQFQYNTYSPKLYLFYTGDDGLLLNGGIKFTRHHYNKPDFSATHNFEARISTLGNYRMAYQGVFRHFIDKLDLLVNIEGDKNRRFNYFFGVGNETENDDVLRKAGYYSLSNSRVFGEIGLQQQFWTRSRFVLLLNLSSNSGNQRSGTILDDYELPVLGTDPLRICKVGMHVDLDFRDTEILPTKGMRLLIESWNAWLLNEPGDYTYSRGIMEWYGTARTVTIGLRVGGWTGSEQRPYYDTDYLGQNSFLRGYRKRRFTGSGAFYFNSNIRIQVVDNTDWFIPHKIGVNLFFDTGRIFEPLIPSSKWHIGYGAGLYVVPVREQYTIAFSIGFSEEEKGLFRFLFGKAF